MILKKCCFLVPIEVAVLMLGTADIMSLVVALYSFDVFSTCLLLLPSMSFTWMLFTEKIAAKKTYFITYSSSQETHR